MDGLAIAITQIASFLSHATSLPRQLRRWTVAAIGVVVSATLLVAATGCGLAALWIGLLPIVGPVWAPVATASALVALALSVIALTRRRGRRPVAPAATSSTAASSTDILIDALRFFQDHKDAALVAAVISGLSAGRRRD